ncbi:MAG: hypothetical protein DRP47_00060 [Candidatus Zixiibacteriota bacterium]|nr:MAG: hypothetical protein DRP47_00060 [candidate division Zixibacteria bacterium]
MLFKKSHTFAMLALMFAVIITQPVFPAVLRGTVIDNETKEPVPLTTIRIQGTGQSMLSNDDGQYRLRLEPGKYNIKFSHVAHYSEIIEITISDSTMFQDIFLRPAVIELPGTTVYNKAYDPGQEIIIRAIAHKEELLRKIHDYQFDAYTKLVVHEIESEDSSSIAIITETQITGFWERPKKYKEIITARKQTSNLQAEQNMITVGQIFNLNANRLDFGLQQVVSPTANDALDYYNYYLMDTIQIDGRPVFQLEIEPRSSAHPLFVGELLIADSTYDVVGVDVGFNEGFDAPYINDLSYRQMYAAFDNDIWMPIEIRYTGEIDVPGGAIPTMAFDFVTALHRYTINEGIPDGIFDQYVIEVAEEADDIDSVAWNANQLIPLTDEEAHGYTYIDSVENLPMSTLGIVKKTCITTLNVLITQYDFFHFNRVEGPYLGFAVPITGIIPNLKLKLGTGYAFEGEYWQHRYELSYTFWERLQSTVSFGYRDQIRNRSTIASPNYNPTTWALFKKIDPYDYFLEKGFDFHLLTKILPKTSLHLKYVDVNQYSVENATDYSLIWAKDKEHRPNIDIINGKMRSVSGSLRWDSSPLIKVKGKESKAFSLPQTILEIGGETSWPQFIDSDFKFQRGYIWLQHKRGLPGLGIFQTRIYAGMSDKQLPPQRYFIMDFGDTYFEQLTSFKTQGKVNFSGDRVLSIYSAQNFGSALFRRLRVPLLRKMSVSFFVYGGAFWCDFRDESIQLPNERLITASKPYSEIGFGFGRIPPIFLRAFFTWQLSDYDTNDFTFKIGMFF